jgi:protein NrfD
MTVHQKRTEAYEGPTYYDMPVIKHAPWKWHVPTYVFLGGTGAGAAIVGAAARLAMADDGEAIARHGHYIGAAGALLGAPLLIADLKTPQRWYNMLRIFRPTSPMSIGSYVLTGFGAITSLGALGEWASGGAPDSKARVLADAMRVPAAVSGALMATYTAALVSATSVPVWAGAPQVLAARYGASSIASGAAALSLAAHLSGDAEQAQALDRITVLGAAAALALTLLSDAQLGQEELDAPLHAGRPGRMHQASLVLYALPLAAGAANLALSKPSRSLSVLGALATLGASFLTRSSVMEAGPPSAKRPRDYHAFTRPQRLPPGEPRPRLPTPRPGMARRVDRFGTTRR